MLHGSREMIMWTAKSVFDKKNRRSCHSRFVCYQSRLVWKIHAKTWAPSLRRKTTTAQKDPSYMIDRIVFYVIHVRRIQKQFSFYDFDITAMDETAVWNDMVSNTTVTVTGSTAHNKVRLSVCLTGKADESKWKPCIVFKGAKRESKFLHEEFKRIFSVATFTNRLTNEELTLR